MMRSTTSAKVIKGVAVFAFWIAVWQLVAMIVGTELLVPSPLSVLKAIVSEIGSEKFRLSVLFSLLRVLGGFGQGGSRCLFYNTCAGLDKDRSVTGVHIVSYGRSDRMGSGEGFCGKNRQRAA